MISYTINKKIKTVIMRSFKKIGAKVNKMPLNDDSGLNHDHC
ncbi:MAG: hypothetical protein JWQ66_2198 [Mucilaginibacter sp.]|jgi:hypothetical protein|nr:hypothetical protein [Mucilaginibacter sp.]